MDLKDIFHKLEQTLERTGYVSKIDMFPGEFHQDSRHDINPHISYHVEIKNPHRDSEMHRLEREIRQDFYKHPYGNCTLRTCIEELSESEERHSINVIFNNGAKDKERTVHRMAIHLTRVIQQYHFKK